MRQSAAPLKGEERAAAKGAAPHFALELAVLACFFGLLFWARYDIIAWYRGWSAPVQTSARIACAQPTEHETRLVYLNARPDGSIDVACGPAVAGPSRGARR